MTVAIDTNVLLDVLFGNSEHQADSLRKIREASAEGDVIVGEVALAELSREPVGHESLAMALSEMGIFYQASGPEAMYRAGVAFQAYLQNRRGFRCAACGANVNVICENCGSSVTRRQHIIADFMIGAHALVHAGRLLTRDRGYYRTYFPELVLV